MTATTKTTTRATKAKTKTAGTAELPIAVTTKIVPQETDTTTAPGGAIADGKLHPSVKVDWALVA